MKPYREVSEKGWFLGVVVLGLLCLQRSCDGGEKGEIYEVTAYCSCAKCCGKWADGITASGKPVRWGVIATDWRALPKGTRVQIQGFPRTTFVALDIGGAIKGKRIDIWYPSHRKALKFGRRKLRVTVLRKEK